MALAARRLIARPAPDRPAEPRGADRRYTLDKPRLRCIVQDEQDDANRILLLDEKAFQPGARARRA
jgi:hypothetical protein